MAVADTTRCHFSLCSQSTKHGLGSASHSRCFLFRTQYGGYWLSTSFLKEVDKTKETTFYDSVTGLPLFVAPRGRSWEEFEAESRSHGWPSFRDQECIW